MRDESCSETEKDWSTKDSVEGWDCWTCCEESWRRDCDEGITKSIEEVDQVKAKAVSGCWFCSDDDSGNPVVWAVGVITET